MMGMNDVIDAETILNLAIATAWTRYREEMHKCDNRMKTACYDGVPREVAFARYKEDVYLSWGKRDAALKSAWISYNAATA